MLSHYIVKKWTREENLKNTQLPLNIKQSVGFFCQTGVFSKKLFSK